MAKSTKEKKPQKPSKPVAPKQAIVLNKLNAAAKILNHPALRPAVGNSLIAGNEGGPIEPLDGKLTEVTVCQAFCNTEQANIGSSTTDLGQAKAAALHHHQATGHSTTVLESTSDN